MGKGNALQVEEINVRGIEPTVQADPGNGGAIDATRSAITELTTAGVETRTLPDPRFVGQEINLVFVSDGGNCTVTADSPINQTGNTVMTFSDVGEVISLVGKYNATDGWEWQVVTNDGVALS